jgi:hypothetical protein
MKDKNEYKYQLYNKFCSKYKHINKQIIFRTVDMASSPGKAFDILEEFKSEYPMSFNLEKNLWESDVFLEYEILQG